MVVERWDFMFNTDCVMIIVGYNSGREGYEQTLYFYWYDSLWLDWMVDRFQNWWNNDRLVD
jgi:hypothetical protein